MQCKNCGIKNSPNSRYCIKCAKTLIETECESEYCPKCKAPLLHSNMPCPYCNDSYSIDEHIFCSECKSSIKKGIIFSNAKKLSDFEKILLDSNSTKVFCDKCIQEQKSKAYSKLAALKNKFHNILDKIPVLSVENPVNLTIIKYCGIVSSQSMVKVDNIAEFKSDTENLSSLNSELEKKFKYGEEACLLSLRKKALRHNTNAVIKCDINYGEMGMSENLFLIGMMGTAVIVEEFEILTEYEQRVYNYLIDESL